MDAAFETLVASLPDEIPTLQVKEVLDPVYYWVLKNVRADMVKPYVDAIASKLGIGKADVKKRITEMRDAITEREAAEKRPEWTSELTRALNGTVKPSIENALLYLQHDPWTGSCGYDEFRDAAVWFQPPPWDNGSKPNKPFRPMQELEDEDASRFQAWLGKRGLDVSYDTAFRSLEIHARTHSFHPIRAYLESLEWDRKPRVRNFLIDYASAPDTEYSRVASRVVLVSSVARVMKPGCKVDTMVILEGDQGLRSSDKQDSTGKHGVGKSSFWRALFGDEYFTDHLSDLKSKDASQDLRSNWCVEDGELDSLSKTEAKTAKNFHARQVDKYRPSYGRKIKAYARQNVFVGSTNEGTECGYLKDQTGNRRYIPVPVTAVKIDQLVEDRDQLWAEAYSLYQSGESWWPTPAEDKLCEAEQDRRRQEDPWESVLSQFFARTTHPTVTGPYLLQQVLNVEPKVQKPYELTRLGTVLKRLGWRRHRSSTEGRPWFYTRPGLDPEKYLDSKELDPVEIAFADDQVSQEEVDAIVASKFAATGFPDFVNMEPDQVAAWIEQRSAAWNRSTSS